jgi:CelD/BcsL family acetyltransferase involved in cellulose biosynthesis
LPITKEGRFVIEITRTSATELTPSLCTAWTEIQDACSQPESPHFDPQLILHTAAVRPGIEVAVLRQGSELVGFLPYCRVGNCGEPPAGTLSDLQGLVIRDDVAVDPQQLLHACRLSQLRFTDVLAEQKIFAPFHAVLGDYPYIDVSQGFEAFRLQRRNDGTDEVQQSLRKIRKIERELGPLRFEPYCTDAHVLDQLVVWKAAQMSKRRIPNALADAWQLQLLRRVATVKSDRFAGMLSALFVGDRLIAGMMGVRSRNVLNGWLTAYEPELSRYSPGLLLHVRLAQHAQAASIQRIDMGRGPEPYKRSFRSGGIPVAEGCVCSSQWAGAIRNAWLQAREWVRNTPLGQPARELVQRWRFARHGNPSPL